MRRIAAILVLIVMLLGLSACKEKEKEKEKVADAVMFQDSLGYNVTVHSMKRVGVCSGSLTQMWQLAGGSVVAVSNDVWSYDAVKMADDCINLGDLKHVNVEQILSSNLDLIIMSATIKGHAEVRDVLEKAGITTAYFDVETFDEYLKVLDIMTSLTGRKDLYEKNGLKVQKEVAKQLARKDDSHPRILQLRALTTEVKVQDSDNMTGKMLAELGCVNIADSEKGLLESLNLEAILKEDPEIIFITIMGEEKQAREMVQKTIYENPAWSKLRAVKENHCYILPKDLFHYKPNQRWGESYKMLVDLLYEAKK